MNQFKTLGPRALVSVLGIPLLIGAILVGKLFLLIIITIACGVALWEWYGLAERKGCRPLKGVGLAALVCIVLDFHFFMGKGFLWIVVLEGLSVFTAELFREEKNHLVNGSITIGGTLFLSFLSFYLLLRQFPVLLNMPYPQGGVLVLMVFASVWICDTAAYFVGSALGKHPLALSVSPKKTWEGAWAGFGFALATAVVFEKFVVTWLHPVDGVVIGILAGTVGQLSDLVESRFKRDVDVKDSSNLLPGHGGMLDRFDSLLMIAPIVYLYLCLRFKILG